MLAGQRIAAIEAMAGSQDCQPQASAARLETANGYRLTADSMIMTAKWLLERRPEGG